MAQIEKLNNLQGLSTRGRIFCIQCDSAYGTRIQILYFIILSYPFTSNGQEERATDTITATPVKLIMH